MSHHIDHTTITDKNPALRSHLECPVTARPKQSSLACVCQRTITEQNPALTNRLECLVTPRRKQSAAKNHRTVTDWNPALSSLRAALFAVVVVVVVVAFCPLPLANASLVSQLSFPPFLRCCDCTIRVLVGGFGWGFF